MTGVDEPHAPRLSLWSRLTAEHPYRRAWSDKGVVRLAERGLVTRRHTRADRVVEGRARDLRMIAGGFLCGVLATVAVAVVAVSWRAVT